jgi:hypothetical protein
VLDLSSWWGEGVEVPGGMRALEDMGGTSMLVVRKGSDKRQYKRRAGEGGTTRGSEGMMSPQIKSRKRKVGPVQAVEL